MIASLGDHTEVPEILLKKNADVNIQSTNGVTALMAAILNANLELVEYLLQSKAYPHIIVYFEGFEITALSLAIVSGKRDIAKMLIDKSEPTTDEFEKNVVTSCYFGDLTLITFLSNKLPHFTNYQRELLDSCINGVLHTVVWKALDSPDTPLVCDVTPLMVASSCGHVDIVDALIQAGADVNKQESYWGLTPLYFAISGGQSTLIVEMLLKNDANPNVIVNNETPLNVANKTEQETIIELLIKDGGKTASQASNETTNIPTSSLTTSELTNEVNKKQTNRNRLPNLESINLFTSHILNRTHTFRDTSAKQEKIKQDNKEKGQEDYLIPITF